VESRILILGLGNPLLSDEGMGVRALGLLSERYALPPAVACLDGGVLGLGLLAYLEGVTHLLVIDTVQNGLEPGALVRLTGADIPRSLSLKLSIHELGFQEVLAISELRGIPAPTLTVLGLEPASLAPGVGLSPTVEAGLGSLVDAAVAELGGWGVAALPRWDPESRNEHFASPDIS
jgi:hydrogenase maturation protease